MTLFVCSKECAEGQNLCAIDANTTMCYDLKTSVEHCGTCGNKCKQGSRCVDGNCICEPSDIWCDDSCVDPRSDIEFCGARGNCNDERADSADYKGVACKNGDICENSRCVCKGVRCGDLCIDPKTNDVFCGASGSCSSDAKGDNFMGEECKNGKICSDGICQCPENTTFCDGNCIDPKTNNTFCGAKADCEQANRGKDCGEGLICVNGACSCPPNLLLCDDSCINPMNNSKYCGADEPCRYESEKECGENYICMQGQCSATKCETGMQLCPISESSKINHCVSILTDDVNNCGDCNRRCENIKPKNTKVTGCTQGKCIYDCEDGVENCGTDYEDGLLCLTTEDKKSNPFHCGSCRNPCNDSVCELGKCNKELNCDHLNLKACATFGCKNTDEKCGPTCLNCKNLPFGASGVCEDAYCRVTTCPSGYHIEITEAKPAYGTPINRCVINTNTTCGANNSTETLDCTAEGLPPNASQAVCNQEGKCIATMCNSGDIDNPIVLKSNGQCQPCCEKTEQGICENNRCVITNCEIGYHIELDNYGEYKCVQNTVEACAPTDSQITNNCATNAIAARCNENGKCTILECLPNYHIQISEDGNESCVMNTNTACALPNSSETKNCKDYSLTGTYHQCILGVCTNNMKLFSRKIGCNAKIMGNDAITCSYRDDYPRYCVPDNGSFTCGYLCSDSDTQTSCSKGCLTLINGAKCSDCTASDCTDGRVCYKASENSFACRDEI